VWCGYRGRHFIQLGRKVGTRLRDRRCQGCGKKRVVRLLSWATELDGETGELAHSDQINALRVDAMLEERFQPMRPRRS
jgi:hypothetical protein